MSKMGNIVLDIQDRLHNTNDSYEKIAQDYGVSVQWVKDAVEHLDEEQYSPYQTSNS